MPVRIVQSKNNARLKELRKAFVRPGRDTRGLVAVEGPHLLEEALRAGLRIATVFLRSNGRGDLGYEPRVGEDVEILLVDPDLFDDVVQTETPQPVAALVEMPDWTWAHILRQAESWPPLLIVLAGLQDPGNLGTILRSAEAFKSTGIISLPGTVNEWNPKVVRSSAGSIFRLPLIHAMPEECFTMLREAGARVLSTSVSNATPIHGANLTGPVAFLIGNEGAGVPAEIAKQADSAVTIPCPGPVESLNAAVAAGVLLYETFRQRDTLVMREAELRGSSR
ncbi:TrmH family RNA methyltransferase [Occallatibacter riparius]|uniref:RNA methyltransferase n=1 Tax=Occallatibacter riparius TaxID=1002689 RepID=A0A9J7BKI3_9BACT|nr:RNA methyltransferase [Occallatibacter riparius]UWZ83167.1 RNA methyltransferase [Occallatibacter riparius]